MSTKVSSKAENWSPLSWLSRTAAATAMPYHVTVAGEQPLDPMRAMQQLAALPPLVTSWEIERLKRLVAEAQQGKRFMLQGGDCAETLGDCAPDTITAKLKIILQMSLVLVYAGKQPVIRVSRMAGQYAKPRSSVTETRTENGAAVTLPSYFGDLFNRSEFTAAARRVEPGRMVEAYWHAGLTLNFVRSLLDAGFADIHHPEYWELGFLKHAALRPEVRGAYEKLTAQVHDGLRFMRAMEGGGADAASATQGGAGAGSGAGAGIGAAATSPSTRGVELFTSHEGLNLYYEAALTRTVPRREGFYNLGTHLPWIGERTRQLDGAHVEYFRGICNPVGVKLGPSSTVEGVLALVDALNPTDEPGKVILIARMGRGNVERVLPGLVAGVKASGKRVLWVCDPMHGNTITTASGIKTRSFDDVLGELVASYRIQRECGSHLGGVHFELTGEDVTECIGGATGLDEAGLSRNYASLCDPRLNYDQALEMAFALAELMREGPNG